MDCAAASEFMDAGLYVICICCCCCCLVSRAGPTSASQESCPAQTETGAQVGAGATQPVKAREEQEEEALGQLSLLAGYLERLRMENEALVGKVVAMDSCAAELRASLQHAEADKDQLSMKVQEAEEQLQQQIGTSAAKLAASKQTARDLQQQLAAALAASAAAETARLAAEATASELIKTQQLQHSQQPSADLLAHQQQISDLQQQLAAAVASAAAADKLLDVAQQANLTLGVQLEVADRVRVNQVGRTG